MKYIKIFENFNIEEELKKCVQGKFTIKSNGEIDVDGNVILPYMKLKAIPFKFNEVSGRFVCSNNRLTNLIGCPSKVGEDFICSHNELISLEGCPIEVGRDFICSNSKLTSLEYCPIEIGRHLICTNNNLSQLNTVSNVEKDIHCYGNDIDENMDGFMGHCGGKIIYSLNHFHKKQNYFLEHLSNKEVNTDQFVYHRANVSRRDDIEKNGLVPKRGRQWLEDTDIEGGAIFATDSDKPKNWFDSTWDDDTWIIDTTKIPNIKWYKDPNFDYKKYRHIFTQQPIPADALELLYRGSGRDMIDG